MSDHEANRTSPVGDDAPVAVVTGAARGLGLGIVGKLFDAGWRVTGSDRDPRITAAMAEVDGGAGRTLGLVVDVTDAADCLATAERTMKCFGRLDALVNNAGVGGGSTPVHETELSEIEFVLAVNLVAPFLMARACVPHIIGGGRGGAVVNMGSVLGARAEAGSGPYSASKAGVGLMGQAMALELAPHGIRVNTIAPGNMLTVMHEEFMADFARQTGRTYDETVVAVRESVPLGRHGTPDDIGDAVTWLLSPQATYVTGQTIHVNGGILLT